MPSYIEITGGVPLRGEIAISGAKNAALPLMCAALLSPQPLRLRNVPYLADIQTLAQLLEQLGVEVREDDGGSTVLHAREITSKTAPYDLVRKMRASILVLGPLLARTGEAKVSLPGGCAIGTRPVDLHIHGLQKMGATIVLEDGYICAQAPMGLKGCVISMPLISVTATENLMTAAVLAQGQTTIINAAREPEVIDLAQCLNKMGAKISGAGTDTIVIEGVSSLQAAEHTVLPDRIETGTWAVAALITGGDLTVTGTRNDFLQVFLEALKDMGADITVGDGTLRVRHPGEPLQARDIITEPYPGIPTDLQAQLMALMTTCKGSASITETIFENRFMHVPELCRMGADITVHGSTAMVRGGSLRGAAVMATDLRASVSLVLAGLAAEGTTQVRRIYHLDRGYERLEEKLLPCGAHIQRLRETA